MVTEAKTDFQSQGQITSLCPSVQQEKEDFMEHHHPFLSNDLPTFFLFFHGSSTGLNGRGSLLIVSSFAGERGASLWKMLFGSRILLQLAYRWLGNCFRMIKSWTWLIQNSVEGIFDLQHSSREGSVADAPIWTEPKAVPLLRTRLGRRS